MAQDLMERMFELVTKAKEQGASLEDISNIRDVPPEIIDQVYGTPAPESPVQIPYGQEFQETGTSPPPLTEQFKTFASDLKAREDAKRQYAEERGFPIYDANPLISDPSVLGFYGNLGAKSIIEPVAGGVEAVGGFIGDVGEGLYDFTKAFLGIKDESSYKPKTPTNPMEREPSAEDIEIIKEASEAVNKNEKSPVKVEPKKVAKEVQTDRAHLRNDPVIQEGTKIVDELVNSGQIQDPSDSEGIIDILKNNLKGLWDEKPIRTALLTYAGAKALGFDREDSGLAAGKVVALQWQHEAALAKEAREAEAAMQLSNLEHRQEMEKEAYKGAIELQKKSMDLGKPSYSFKEMVDDRTGKRVITRVDTKNGTFVHPVTKQVMPLGSDPNFKIPASDDMSRAQLETEIAKDAYSFMSDRIGNFETEEKKVLRGIRQGHVNTMVGAIMEEVDSAAYPYAKSDVQRLTYAVIEEVQNELAANPDAQIQNRNLEAMARKYMVAADISLLGDKGRSLSSEIKDSGDLIWNKASQLVKEAANDPEDPKTYGEMMVDLYNEFLKLDDREKRIHKRKAKELSNIEGWESESPFLAWLVTYTPEN